ncbi:hypothetical protein FO519_004619 [Halicephalobus sp. NKZ332]|nr:hypothetical protein FO519_004619 [Halicephalobus sp. NKZ332]
MRGSTFLRITVDERPFFERTFRAYLLAQFDTGMNKSEFTALNSEEVKERLEDYYPRPTEGCLACERAGKNFPKNSAQNPSTPSAIQNSLSSGMCSTNNVETKPHMKYSNIEQGYGVDVSFYNPLYRKGIARLPDLRLIGHNVNKLIPAVAPKKTKEKRDPVAVHLCREYYNTMDISMTELRPETKAGAVLPRRMIYNYLRYCMKKPKPITWQKKPKKSMMRLLQPESGNPQSNGSQSGSGNLQNNTTQQELGSSQSNGYSSAASSVKSMSSGKTKITIVDIFKWLGLYCVVIDENKAKFVFLKGYEEKTVIKDPIISLHELLKTFPKAIFDEESLEWKRKKERIEFLIDGQPLLQESKILKMILICTKKEFFSSNLQYFKTEPKLNLIDIFEINKDLEKKYLEITNFIFSQNSEIESEEYGTDPEEDYEWSTCPEMNFGIPEEICPEEYSLGDFVFAKMRDPWKKDISNVVPPSKLLEKKFGERRTKTKKSRIEGLLPVRKKTKWDESSSEDEAPKNKNQNQREANLDLASSIQEIFGQNPPKDPEGNVFDEEFSNFDQNISPQKSPREVNPSESISNDTLHNTNHNMSPRRSSMKDVSKEATPSPKKVRFVFFEKTTDERSESFDDESFMEIITRPIETESNHEEELRKEKEQNSQILPLPSTDIIRNSVLEKNETKNNESIISDINIVNDLNKITDADNANDPNNMNNIDVNNDANDINIINNTNSIDTIDDAQKIEEELKERRQKTKRIYYCKDILEFFNKPLKELERILREKLRKEENLEEIFFFERESEAFWRIFGVDLDENLFQSFLKNMKFNFYFFLKSKNEFKKLMCPTHGIYEELLSRRKSEMDFIKRESKKKRRSSLGPDFERFQFSVFNPESDKVEEVDYSPRKESPFDLFLKQLPPGSLRIIRTTRRSVSLPPKLDADLVPQLVDRGAPESDRNF